MLIELQLDDVFTPSTRQLDITGAPAVNSRVISAYKSSIYGFAVELACSLQPRMLGLSARCMQGDMKLYNDDQFVVKQQGCENSRVCLVLVV